jgi:predicted nucleic acid-binding protein
LADAQAQPGERRQVVLDTSVLLNFLRVGRLDLLVELPGHEFLVTDHVRGEVTDPGHAGTLEEALQGGRLIEVRIDDPAELVVFAQLTALRVLGVGECAALALAVHRGLQIAIDDKAARKKAVALFRFERFVGTVDLVVAAIRGGLIDVQGADEIKRRWQKELKFRLAYESFEELT